jgi:DNA replication and repair protein RecF
LPGDRLLLVGRNGAGKTTLLEAIYLAATSRSFRTPRLEECARRGGDGFTVQLDDVGESHRSLALGWRADGERTRTLDGKTARLAEQLAALPLLAWTEAESALVAGPPGLRRRFFDRGLVLERPAVLARLGRYERALAEKRALLAGGGPRTLEAWNELLAREGAAIAAARAEFVVAVADELATAIAASGLALPAVGLAYRPSPPAASDGEAALAAALAAAEGEERRRRQPLVGAQRDEIEISWNGAPARRSASAGERKALGLLLVAALAARLAAGERGAPTLLLDDADSELDRERLERLLGAFDSFPRLLVTSNRPAAWPPAARLATVAVEELHEDGGRGS